MSKVLVVVDMQKDFIDGSLGSQDAVTIVPAVCDVIRAWDGPVFVTRDTHQANYMDTQEGKNLPVPHCIEGTDGWEVNSSVQAALTKVNNPRYINKVTFGYYDWANIMNPTAPEWQDIESITLVGLCTDICVVSNALVLKALFPEVPVRVIENATAATTPEKKAATLAVMQSCQIEIA